MQIESIRLKNYKIFRDIHIRDIPKLCIVVGANGSGKTTLFDVFGFLQDCLKGNVRQALDARGRFKEVLSRDSEEETILIEIQYRMPFVDKNRLVTYTLEIGEQAGAPYIKREILRYKRGAHGKSFNVLDFSNGEGYAIYNEEDFNLPDEELTREKQKLYSPDILAIKGLGQFERYKAANSFRRLIESWHLYNIRISSLSEHKEPTVGSEHLSETGNNLAHVARFLCEHHPAVFDTILKKMAQRVPGLSNIEPTIMADGSMSLHFQDGAFKAPFLARYVSEGTIKMFAYLVLLYDPRPHPLLCVDEPENQLYPKLMAESAEEFRLYANRGGQVLVSTHSPEFLNAAELDEVFWLVKKDGYTQIRRKPC